MSLNDLEENNASNLIKIYDLTNSLTSIKKDYSQAQVNLNEKTISLRDITFNFSKVQSNFEIIDKKLEEATIANTELTRQNKKNP